MKTSYSLLSFFVCIALFAQAQTVSVVKTYQLSSISQKAYYPVFSPDGSNLLFSSESYAGLNAMNLSTQKITVVSNEPGAGYQPVVHPDNGKIFYKVTSFNQGRRLDAIKSYNPSDAQTVQMLAPQRNLKQPRNYHNGFLVSADKKIIKATFGKTKNPIPVYVFTDDLKLMLYKNGVSVELNPVADAGGYIWASLSPDNKKILFTAARKGTFVCDLQGKILASFGQLNAPVWYNDELVVGMEDKDNGQFITSSRIMLKSLNGKISLQLSDNALIAMYPAASKAAGKVAFNTLDGKIYIVELKSGK